MNAGVKRISSGVYTEMRQVLVAFLKGVIPDATTLAEHCRRSTITVNDILLALKRRGMCGTFLLHFTLHVSEYCQDYCCLKALLSSAAACQDTINAKPRRATRRSMLTALLPNVLQHAVRLRLGALPDHAGGPPHPSRPPPRGHPGASSASVISFICRLHPDTLTF